MKFRIMIVVVVVAGMFVGGCEKKSGMTAIEKGAYSKSMEMLMRRLERMGESVGTGLSTMERSKGLWANLGAYHVSGWVDVEGKKYVHGNRLYWRAYLILRNEREPANPDSWESCRGTIDTGYEPFKQE